MANDFFKIKKGVNILPAEETPNAKGDIVYDESEDKLKIYNGAVDKVVTATKSETLTNKTIDASSNTLSNITNTEIKSDAAIADTKLATISTVGKVSNSATTAASANTASAIVARDGSGNFTAGTITANLTGNASGTAASFTGSLSGDVTSTGMSTTVATVGGSSASNVHSAELAANAATSSNTISTIVKRDSSGNFSAGTITASLTGLASLNIASSNLDTDGTLAANLDTKVASQKAVKTYVDTSVIATIPTGTILDFAGPTAPAGFLLLDGSSQLRASYPTLFSIIAPSQTCTMTMANPCVVTANGHGLVTGQSISFETTGTTPFSPGANYYIIYQTDNTFWVATSYANAIANTKISTFGQSQSGTHTLRKSSYGINGTTEFYLPNALGRATIGAGAGSGLTSRPLGYSTGSEVISMNAMPSHNHTGSSIANESAHTHPIAVAGVQAQPVNSFLTGNTPASTINSNAGSAHTHSLTVASAGGGTLNTQGAADGNMPPVLTVYKIIKT